MEYRNRIYINSDWESCLNEKPWGDWTSVEIPHNWEDYHGYHRVSHGNLHGTAWYRKKLTLAKEPGRHYFLTFEGVGSYGDVWVNDVSVGRHEGGRTQFSLDITDALKEKEGENLILVKASHPEKIDDLPWVCGGCFGTPNTEGSQPLGIFRPVSIYETGPVGIVPFGVGISTPRIGDTLAEVKIRVELLNNRADGRNIKLINKFKDGKGRCISSIEQSLTLSPGEFHVVEQTGTIREPLLWGLENPHLYEVETLVVQGVDILDRVTNTFGVRTIEWENFESSPNEILSPELAAEKPSRENGYFVTYTRGDDQAPVGIEPGGVEVNLPPQKREGTVIDFSIRLINRDRVRHQVSVESFVQDYHETKSIANMVTEISLEAGERKTVTQRTDRLHYLDPWTEEHPQLHSVITTVRDREENLMEYNQTRTTFAICSEEGPVNRGYPYIREEKAREERRRLLLNGEPVFINGTCEYEHLLGNDHAFYEEQIRARMEQIKAAGFNSFREAHCPHNLRYLEYCDKFGILHWAQMGAHLYFDNDRFRENFLILTEEWVRERRNSPSLFLWGIQNESMLPADFTNRLRELIRSLDETSPEQRKVVTCNGGFGSDWNVPQNWSGTYGRSVEGYDGEITEQLLVGEYGQYRVLGKHEEGDMESRQNSGGDVSEELFAYCLGTKIRLAEKVKNRIYGHYQWIFNTHANPGRETLFCLDGSGSDGVGVVNSKGLISSWGEPTDAYFMYRSYYAPVEREPMVYIVSHTWPERFAGGAGPADITVYSNCERVELLNDYGDIVLGEERNMGRGIPFVFPNVSVQYDILHARGYLGEEIVAEDVIQFSGLPGSPRRRSLYTGAANLTKGKGEYLYRMSCGGPDYTDGNGNLWEGDRMYESGGYGWKSWAMAYDDVEPLLGSVRQIHTPLRNSRDQDLFQSFRYGRDRLEYIFPVPDGSYEMELYFMEPWYGVGGGMDCTGWRLFDVAVNGEVLIEDLDIWREAGCQRVLKKTLAVKSREGLLRLHFPRVKSYQALICAVAVKRG